METLNPQQQKIVKHKEGPALVIAGAGSGKTRVITYRVSELIRSGVAPSAIMLLTFTNKAAAEMAERVGKALDQQEAQKAIVHGTFHSLANRFLRRYATFLRYENNFSILDSADSRDLIKASIAETIGSPSRNFPKASVLQNMYSLAFNLTCDEITIRNNDYLTREFEIDYIIGTQYPYFEQSQTEIVDIFHTYRKKKRRNNAMDFDDLLENWLDLLLSKQQSGGLPRGGLPLVQQIKYILVDEYQDTNTVQASILDNLCQGHKNLMVVGDDAQSIYSWRGANFKNILNFPTSYDAVTYRLEQNYRSTPDILALANNSINLNKEQFQKDLYSILPQLEKPSLHYLYDTENEAHLVVEQILELQNRDISLNEMSVLYRNHVQSAALQIELTHRDIPFVIRSGVKFFEQAHMKDIISFLKIVFNPLDEIAWMRVLKLIPGIGSTTAQKIFNVFVEQQAVRLTFDNMDLQKKIPKKAREHWEKLLNCFKMLLEDEVPPTKMISLVYETVYQDYLLTTYENARQREADIGYLQDFSAKYKTLERLLNELSLVGATIIKDFEEDQVEEDEYLTLSTIHQAKGLEWDAVFIIGLTEGQLPHQRCMEPEERLEEERRLFYVAITRARRFLTITAPRISSAFGKTEMFERSRFVEECPRDLVTFHNHSSNDDYGYSYQSYSSYKSRMTF